MQRNSVSSSVAGILRKKQTSESSHTVKATDLYFKSKDSPPNIDNIGLANYYLDLSKAADQIAGFHKTQGNLPAENYMRIRADDDRKMSKLCRQLATTPNDIELLSKRIEIYLAERKFELAIKDIENILQYDKDNKTALKKLQEAQDECDKQRFDHYTESGENFFKKGDFDSALTQYNQALEIFPKNSRVLALRGRAYSALKDLSNAKNDFDTALKINPKYYYALAGRAYVHALQSKFDLAINDCNIALEMNPDIIESYECYDIRGGAFYYQNKFAEAILDYSAILSKIPHHIPSLISRGTTYLKTKNFDLAVKDFETILLKHPDHKKALRTLDIIQKINEIQAQKQDAILMIEADIKRISFETPIEKFETARLKVIAYKRLITEITTSPANQSLKNVIIKSLTIAPLEVDKKTNTATIRKWRESQKYEKLKYDDITRKTRIPETENEDKGMTIQEILTLRRGITHSHSATLLNHLLNLEDLTLPSNTQKSISLSPSEVNDIIDEVIKKFAYKKFYPEGSVPDTDRIKTLKDPNKKPTEMADDHELKYLKSQLATQFLELIELLRFKKGASKKDLLGEINNLIECVTNELNNIQSSKNTKARLVNDDFEKELHHVKSYIGKLSPNLDHHPKNPLLTLSNQYDSLNPADISTYINQLKLYRLSRKKESDSFISYLFKGKNFGKESKLSAVDKLIQYLSIPKERRNINFDNDINALMDGKLGFIVYAIFKNLPARTLPSSIENTLQQKQNRSEAIHNL